MKPNVRFYFTLLGLLLLILAFWQVAASASGLQTITSQTTPRITFLGPRGALDGSRPLVLIGHGFAGSGVLMRSFAYPIAHAGYVVALWDFDGHGTNPTPIPQMRSDGLLANAELALAEAQKLGLVQPGRLAILGHSMGSGVALNFGIQHPETAATIAVSPTGANVTAELPRNLLLMAGSNERGFVANAQELLASAGGKNSDLAAGKARKFVEIPWVEHVSILLVDRSHNEAIAWLDGVFGRQPGAERRPVRLILWYLLGIGGVLLAAAAGVPATPGPRLAIPALPLWRRGAALLGGALGATLLLALAGRLRLDLPQVFGLLVGGYLFLWFALAGGLALLILWPRLGTPDRPALLAAGLIFAALWLGVGLLGGEVWLPWLLIRPRLLLWPLGALAFLPWALALAVVSQPARPWGRFGWWLGGSLALIGALVLALYLSPGLFFLSLILPLFPLMLGFHALAAGRQRNVWAFALSGAGFLAWLVAAVFPLQ